MEMTGEQRIGASRQRVWDALNDPEVLRQCIPGCQSLTREEDGRLSAVAEVKIGPIGARFRGVVALSDLDPPNGYTITGQGSGGVAGSAKGGARVRLRDEGAVTLLTYEVEAEVGGRMAQLGGPLIDATARQMAQKFFARFEEVVAGGGEAAVPVETGAAPVVAPAAGAPVATVAASAAPATFPWGLAVVLALAILAGFLLGRSAAADWWVVAVAALVIAAVGAGFDAGRRGGTR